MLTGLAGNRNWRSRLAQHQVFLFWAQVVGEETAAVCRPEVIRDSVLWVRVADPVWGQQLQYEKNAIMEAVNRRLPGERQLTGLRFRFDPALAHELDREQQAQPQPPPSPRAIDPDREARFKEIIAGIEDSQARANLLRLWRHSEKGGRSGQ
ncbi:DUF721 domain-containing protein [Desulfurivibrio dismutans]|uniref:DUF721 domain-containing protein n=1 Tax=Desulfurivibrio dismutans TaxID=1398908 RepID=UPI0023DAE3DF|nr:DUF721 domain-containing protein [Desulfurivibrio alkaliphilus]MDF1615591.1 DUF721 domain-containing protein [Desulfurivibrio alkaliphilus]